MNTKAKVIISILASILAAIFLVGAYQVAQENEAEARAKASPTSPHPDTHLSEIEEKAEMINGCIVASGGENVTNRRGCECMIERMWAKFGRDRLLEMNGTENMTAYERTTFAVMKDYCWGLHALDGLEG